MDGLNLLQIEQISRDVQREDISFSHLCHDLIDHVCCDVEWEMEQGLSFSDAYLKVKQKIGFNGLKKIQSDTLYAVDSKYRTMKNTMKISGVAGTVLLGFSALFKIMHWPGAGIMMTLGAFVLAFIFMSSSLSVLYRESKSGRNLLLFITGFLAGFSFILAVLFKVQHWPGAGWLLLFADFFFCILAVALLVNKMKYGHPERRSLYIIGILSAILYLAGLLFKFQHWPGAAWMLVIGSLVLAVIVFPWYTWAEWKDASYTHASFLFLVPVLVWIFTSGGLINLRVSGNYMAGFIRDYDRQEALNEYYLEQNGRMILQSDTSFTQYNELLQAKSLALYREVDQFKRKLVSLSMGTPREADPSSPNFIKDYAFRQLDAPTPNNLLTSGSEDYERLKSSILGMQNFVRSQVETGKAEPLSDLLNPDLYFPDARNTGVNRLGAVLNKLSLLQNAVLFSESVLLKKSPEKALLASPENQAK